MNVGGPGLWGRALFQGSRWELLLPCLQNTHPEPQALEQLLKDKVEDDVRKAGMGLWGLANKGNLLWASVPKPLLIPCPFSSDTAALRVCPLTERDWSWPPHHTLCPRYYCPMLGGGNASRSYWWKFPVFLVIFLLYRLKLFPWVEKICWKVVCDLSPPQQIQM